MGKTLKGGTTHEKNISMLTPDQQRFLSGLGLGGLAQQAGSAYGQFLQPFDQQQSQNLFNQSVVDPAMMNFQNQILPSIQQRFVDANAGSSSALNQALAQSATDLTTALGSQYGQFFQNQQQSHQQNQMNALSGLSGLAGQQTFTPIVSQQEGILGPLLGAAGSLGGAALMSSEKVKENIKNFTKVGLEDLKNFKVKQYDYIEEVGGAKDKIGLIAEDLPKEITLEKDNILHVDLYALMGVMINSIKELNQKVEKLEKA